VPYRYCTAATVTFFITLIKETCYIFVLNGTHLMQVALQFPDDLMGVSVTVVQLLRQLTMAEIVILADTSYGR